MPPDDARARAQTIRDQFAITLTNLRNDTDLSDEGRQKRIAAAWIKARDEIQRLKADRDSTVGQRRTRLERRVFGVGDNPSDAVAYRDAVTRAEAVTSEDEAQQLLDRSVRIGDDQLARAVALIATERGYVGVWVDYRDTLSSTAAREFTELAELKRQASSRSGRLADDMVFGLPKPKELSLLNDPQLAAMAQQ